jgi:glutamyl-tRNA synthetase
MRIKTRIAPSPTGYGHVGHLRTMLYDYAFAKKHKGTFLVRIEDTDQNRFVNDSSEQFLKLIEEMNLTWDEGPKVGGGNGPYYQSERLHIYKKYYDELISKGHAYYCFCSKERIDDLKKEQRAKGVKFPKYDRKCLSLSPEEIERKLINKEPYVIRLKVPKNETLVFKDEVYGEITFNSDDVEDKILIKSDGFPVYHFAVVVDDHLMNVSHVMRGNDWLSSAPIHVLLYKAFGWDMPIYAHLPNLKDKDSTSKMSKRKGSFFVTQFLEEGYVKEALLNFVMFLGWNPGTEKEIYSVKEFVKDFSIERIGKTDLVVFDRDKLDWMNGYYIRNFSDTRLLREIAYWADNYNPTVASLISENVTYFKKVLKIVKDRLKKLNEIPELVDYFFNDFDVDLNLVNKYSKSPNEGLKIAESYIELLQDIKASDWQADFLHDSCFENLTKLEMKPKQAFMTLRGVLTNKTQTPQLFDVMEVLGKTKVLKRLNNYVSAQSKKI